MTPVKNTEAWAQAIAHAVGVKIINPTGHYKSNDPQELECLKCHTQLKQPLLIRKLKEKQSKGQAVECRYCTIEQNIPAIKEYFSLQETEKLTERAAKESVFNRFGINPRSVFQSYQNDYRDDKLTPEIKSLLESHFSQLLEKKKQGNKFTDEELVAFLEKIYGEKPISGSDFLQSEEHTIRRFRTKKTNGTLPENLEQRLLAVGVNLEPEVSYTQEERLEQLDEFYKENRRLPKDSKSDDTERSLYCWYRDKKHQIRHGEIKERQLVSAILKYTKT